MAHPHSGLAGFSAELWQRDSAQNGPKTPEPFNSGNTDSGAIRLPSPPRPRLRLKRRNAPKLSAPTQHFLASVAAADMPIPSIEEPEIAPLDLDMTDPFTGINRFHDEDLNLLSIRGRTFSPPKTPAPGVVPSLSPSRYPNWTIDSAFSSSAESSPERECSSSRPSTSRSTQTSFSLLSGLSQTSEDDHRLSAEGDGLEQFAYSASDDGFGTVRSAAPLQKPVRKAPWTKAMNAHLWATYVLYQQDPKVTPFRVGKSCIPPHGVCLRVAREAKRSWKGAKALSKASGSRGNKGGSKSGSSTPTGENAGVFMEWPHTGAATRAHFRELCKMKASTPGARGPHFMSQSPAPVTQAASRHFNRRSTPVRSSSIFGTMDMAMSLTMSTSETMQPEGPLAQLTSSLSEPTSENCSFSSSFSSDLSDHPLPSGDGEASFAARRGLGAPFTARSYGPSSSSSLAAMLGLSNSQQPHTIGPRRNLQPPVRLSRSSTQKRRATRPLGSRKRPTLGSDIFTDPSVAEMQAMDKAEAEFSSTQSRRDDLFVPRIEAEPVIASHTAPELPSSRLEPPLLPPPRLGSPFSGSSASFSFPNRFSQPVGVELADLSRRFATVRPTDMATAAPTRNSLASRLAYLDQRLKELNTRDPIGRRRSGSPL